MLANDKRIEHGVRLSVPIYLTLLIFSSINVEYFVIATFESMIENGH